MIKIIQQTIETKSGVVNVSQLSKGTHYRVLVECPDCGEQKTKAIRDIYVDSHTYCTECSRKRTIRSRMLSKYIGLSIKDFKCVHLDADYKHCVIECNVCQNIKEVTLGGFRKGITHKQCSKDLKLNDTQFYSIWANMRTRTCNPNYEKWHRYGGRGISSDEFAYFVDFHASMYTSYLKHVKDFGESQTTLDRINSDGNYTKDNCRWATWDEQADNKERNIVFTAIAPDGTSFKGKNLKKFCESHGIEYKLIGAQVSQKPVGVPYRNRRTGWVFIKDC